ncbi:uncharacterized protein LOC111519200 isoform X3 [Drosophila willistoni]|uniref:uncharacterized protein LOC111519200 isoform X3 n=1 Tax=Drosophila willistoni TaxID=7260 RepID=UPI000C26D244|nr:uncharacterized protein LOC111519200 isoform X3 [Drosophila willistoni]
MDNNQNAYLTPILKIRRLRPNQTTQEDDEPVELPMIDTGYPFRAMRKRHFKDKRHIRDFDIEVYKNYKYKNNDLPDILITDPSYSKFKIPFEVICNNNYKQAVVKYNNQFCHEIDKLIENQSCAREAAYFIRVISYTTLWPPYHSVAEINRTSQKFFSLTPQEKKRFRWIMANDII